MKIRPLPADVVAQIKSSTAIVSLASVVLELLGNALDAEATKIDATVDFGRGGCTVEDNGLGIVPLEFREEGGLGKLHYTSKYHAEEPRLGRKGAFLASLAAMSLLTITSHHHEHRSHNSLTAHHSKTISRQLPAPRHHEINYDKHGTRVTVRNLFGNLPVRVKQRPLVAEQKAEHDRLWEGLKREVVGLILSWRGSVSLRIRDADNRTLLSLAGLAPAPNTRHIGAEIASARSPELQYTLNILTQAKYICVDDWASWVPASASTSAISITGAVSLDPVPTKRVQFISFGFRPLSSEAGHNELYDEVNRIFALSSFGAVEDSHAGDAETRWQNDRRFKSSEYTNHQLQGRKGVDRYPMFHLRINLKARHKPNGDDRFLENETNLQAVVDVMNAMITQWLFVHHFRPRKPWSKRIRPGTAPTSASESNGNENDPPPSPLSPRSSGARGMRKDHAVLNPPFIDANALDNRKRKRSPTMSSVNYDQQAPRRPFVEWTRIKSGRAEFFNNICFSDKPKLEVDVHTTTRELSQLKHSVPSRDQVAIFDVEPVLPGALNPPDPGQPHHESTTLDKRDDTIKWTDPIHRKSFFLNARTGTAMPTSAMECCHIPPIPPRSSTLSNLDKSLRIQKGPALAKTEPSPWLNGILQDWDNPIFNPTETRIQQIPLEEGQVGSERHTRSYRIECSKISINKTFSESSASNTSKLSKRGLQKATVIAQVDKKFILARLQNDASVSCDYDSAGDVIVMIDQHAADERIRVEKLLTDLCAPLQPDQAYTEYRSTLGHKSHVAFTILEKPIQFSITSHEVKLYVSHAERFAAWGILYGIASSRTPDEKEQSLLLVTTLPPSISERCKADAQLSISFLRSIVWKYAEDDVSHVETTLSPSNSKHDQSPLWLRRLSTCPQELLDMINSRACRSAIMFNDELDLDGCKTLVAELSQCVFPFMCAHGRPSMVPVLALGAADSRQSAVALGLGVNAQETQGTGFVQAWKKWKSR